MINNIVNSFMGSVQIHEPHYWEEKSLNNTIDLSEIPDLNGISKASFISPRIETYALVGHGEISKPSLVLGIQPDKEAEQIKLDQRIVQGSYFNSKKGALLSKDLASFLEVEIGDSVVLFGQGYQGSIASGIVPVLGTVNLNTPELNRRTLFLDWKSAEDIYSMQNRATSIILGTEGNWKPLYNQTIQKLDTNQLAVMSWQDKLPELVQLIKADSAGGILVLTILYVIISFGFLGIIIMLTEERSFEYGVMLAVGMKKSRMIFVQFLETLIMAFIGLLVGLGLSFPVVYYFHYHPIDLSGQMKEAIEKFGFEAVIPTSLAPSIAWSQALLVFALVILVNMYTIYKIKNMKPVEAMRR